MSDAAPPPPGGDRVAAAARSNLALTPLVALAGLAGSVVVVRTLAPEEFALFAVAIALRGAIGFITDLGMGTAAGRAFAQFDAAGVREQARAWFWRLLALRAVIVAALAAVVGLFPDAAAELLGLREDERWFLVLMLLIAAGEVIAVLGSVVLNATYRQATLNRITLGLGIFQPVAVIAAAGAGLGLRGIIAAVVAGSLGKAALVTACARHAVGRMAAHGAPLPDVRRMLTAVAASGFVGKLAGWLHQRQLVTVIAAGSRPRPELASFAIAYDFAHQVLVLLASPLYSLLLPTFSQRRDPAAAAQLLRGYTRALSFAVLPAAGALLAAWPAIVDVLFGAEYADTLPYAAIVIAVFALENVFSGPAATLMLAQDDLVRAYLRVKVVTAAVAPVYLVIATQDLLLTTAVMMGVRLASALALHVILHRRGFRCGAGWVAAVVVAAAAAGGCGYLAGLAVPGSVGDLVAVPACAAAIALALIRLGRLYGPEDAALSARVLPAPLQRRLSALLMAPS